MACLALLQDLLSQALPLERSHHALVKMIRPRGLHGTLDCGRRAMTERIRRVKRATVGPRTKLIRRAIALVRGIVVACLLRMWVGVRRVVAIDKSVVSVVDLSERLFRPTFNIRMRFQRGLSVRLLDLSKCGSMWNT